MSPLPQRPFLSLRSTRRPSSTTSSPLLHPPLLLPRELRCFSINADTRSEFQTNRRPPSRRQGFGGRPQRGYRRPLWKNAEEINPPDKKLHLKIEDMDAPMIEAASKRWNGRRSLYLGNWKERRDGAFAKYENRGVPFGKTKHPVIDGVFGRETREVDLYPCVQLENSQTREIDKESNDQIAADLNAVCHCLREADSRLILICWLLGSN